MPSTNEKPITYVDDDGVVCYRASGLGSCPRALWASRKGYDPVPYPDTVLQAFGEGHDLESIILDKLDRPVHDRQREVVVKIPLSTPVHIVGHIDGTIDYEGEPCVVDAKALSDDNFKKWMTYGFEKFPKYAWQLSAYAYGARSKYFCMAVYNKDTQQLSTSFHFPPYSFRNFLERIISIESILHQDMPPCQPDAFFCPFNYLEDTFFDTVALAGGVDQVRQNDLWTLAHSYRSAKRRETEFKNEAADILHQIELRLKSDETKLQVRKTGAPRPYSIQRITQRRKSIDKVLLGSYLQTQGHNLVDYEREEVSTYIKITEVRQRKDEDAGTDDQKRL